MCACRLEANKSSPCSSPAAGSLEDYLPYMESMGLEGCMEGVSEGGASSSHQDDIDEGDEDSIYAQLQQKERDLHLAAELGKALLDQNQELQAKNQLLVEQYSHQIEELKQEKHEVKLRLERAQDEYELTLRDLQQELAQVREQLNEKEDNTKRTDSARSEVMKELTLQNQRLTQQLKKACHTEESLQNQVESLKQQIANRRTSLQDHVHQLQVLTEEIQMLTERRSELERRVNHLSSERDTMAAGLEEAQDRILMLEKHKYEQERQLRMLEQQKTELEEQNSHLLHRLDTLSIHSAHSISSNHGNFSSHHGNNGMSLMSELSKLDHGVSTDSLDAIGTSHHQFGDENQSRGHPMSGISQPCPVPQIFLQEPESEDDFECDDDITMASTCMSADSLDVMHAMARQHGDVEEERPQQNRKLDDKSELHQVHRQLQSLYHQLQHKWDKSDMVHVSDDDCSQQLRQLTNTLEQMESMFSHKLHDSSPQWSSDEEGISSNLNQRQMEQKVTSLQTELSNSRSQMQQLQEDLAARDQQLRHRDIQMSEMKDKLRNRDSELKQLRKEHDKLQDEAAGLTRDAIVDQARWERDQALKKRNKLEVELGQVRVDLMSLEAQLMEAVQQKLELSQQLDLWQVDMQELIGTQVAKQMEEEDTKSEESRSSASSPQPPRKRFPFRWT